MDFQFEPDEESRPRHGLGRVGFGLIALALGLLCVVEVSLLAYLFGAQHQVQALHDHPAWLWLVDAPITWGSLVGSYLLWALWNQPSWRRRAGLLLIMNAIDAGMWTVVHAEELGLGPEPRELSWTFFLMASGLGWCELLLAASLAAEIAAQLGNSEAVDSGRNAYSVAIIGLILWAITALSQTDWGAWPLRLRPTAEYPILLLLMTVLLILLTFLVTVLCLTAARLSGRYLREQARREVDDELLKSRSETEADDLFWRR